MFNDHHSIELKTAEDRDILNNEAALITYLELESLHNPIVNQVMKLRKATGISLQYALALLAYHSLATLERTRNINRDLLNVTPMIPLVQWPPEPSE